MTVDPNQVNPLLCKSVTEQCPLEASIYGYYPSLGWNAFFAALFGICFFVNVILGLRFRTWTYAIAMTLGCTASSIGYIGRCLMHDNPFNRTGFTIQITCLTFSTAFNCAAIYLILKHIVLQFGVESSRIRPRYYTWAFIIADILALSLQAGGGAIAGSAGDDVAFRNIGDKLMVIGISWQVLTLVVFAITAADYVMRRRKPSQPMSIQAQRLLGDRKFQAFVLAVIFAYTFLFVRCVYRIAEMAGGWSNPVMQDQALFIGIDSCMVGLATTFQTFLHPGFCFPFLGRRSARAQAAEDFSLGDTNDTTFVNEMFKRETGRFP